MNHREEFLRDRLQPRAPGGPSARRPDADPPFRPPIPSAQRPVAARPPEPPPPPEDRPPEERAGSVGAPGTALPVEPPERGWQRAVRLVTFDRVRPGPSAAQRQEAEFEAAIRAPLRGVHKVGVVGKGGVGKTSVAAGVGSLLAEYRRDHVVAIDADPAFGRLSSRVDPRSGSSFWELTADTNLRSFDDVAARLGRNPVGLHVLRGEPRSGPRRVLDPAVYREAALRLDRHFAISVIDCGSALDAPLTQEVLRDLDALIVVSSPWADGAAAAARILAWLSDRDLKQLLQNSLVALNDADGHADKRTRASLAREFVEHGRPVVEVPFDPHLRPGGVIDVRGALAPATRRRLLEITATIAGYFAARSDGEA